MLYPCPHNREPTFVSPFVDIWYHCMFRRHVPNLDDLESPLISANPLEDSMIGTIPGSALAERIFNDPEAWDDADISDLKGGGMDDAREAIAWLEGELEKYHSADDQMGLSSIEKLELDLFNMLRGKQSSSMNLPAPPGPSKSHGGRGEHQDSSGIFPRSWCPENGAVRFSSPLPASERNDLCGQCRKPYQLDLGMTICPAASNKPATPLPSTWSILELYGINPDTPCNQTRHVSLLPPYSPTPASRPFPQSSLAPQTNVFIPTSFDPVMTSLETLVPVHNKLPHNASLFIGETTGMVRKLPVLPNRTSIVSHTACPQGNHSSGHSLRTGATHPGSTLIPSGQDYSGTHVGEARQRSNSGNLNRFSPAGPRPRPCPSRGLPVPQNCARRIAVAPSISPSPAPTATRLQSKNPKSTTSHR